MKLPTRIISITGAAAVALALPAPRLAAQADIPPASGDVVELPRYEVTGVPPEESVNPLTRPIEAVLGDARSILETPRAVSTITQALLRERGINGVPEFVAFAPGSYAPASYGKATIPFIRGDLAETFFNGQRAGYNNFGYLPSFNNVEALDVVRGPGSAVYGSGFFTGGYVNYVTKTPKFTPETTVTLRLGTWSPAEGGSWLNSSWQIDATAPLPGGKSAWRISYEGKEDDTFFRRHGGRDDREDVFVSWILRDSGPLTLEANAQYMWQDAPQLLGVNRPSQDLIDRGIYYTGDLPDSYDDVNEAIGGTIPGDAWVDLPRDATLLSPGDFSNANVVRAQVIATVALSPSAKLVNRSLFEHVDRRRYHAFEYAEWVEQWTAENRTELHATARVAGVENALVAGLAVRWEQRESHCNYFNEYFFQYDITRADRVFSHEKDYPASYWPGYAGPGGKLFFPASSGSPETTHSTLWNPALFLQDEIKLHEKFSLLAGARLDGFFAKAHDPLGAAAGDDPVWSDRNDDTALSWNASALWRPAPRATFYASYQRACAVLGNVAGGGIMLTKTKRADGSSYGVIDPENFKNLSRLAEIGAKFSLLENKLYAGFALYDQRRSEAELGGEVKNLKMRGAELELVFQPTTRLSATLNASFIDGRFDNSTATQSGGNSLYNLYAAGRGPGGLGNGIGFTWDKLPPGDYRIPGLSRAIVNASFSYQLPCGLGGGLNGSWQSEQPGNLLNEYHIPAQIFLNASLFYRRAGWELSIDILNVLNRRNWIHNGDNWSNNVLVYQDLPLRVEGYVKMRF